LNIIIYLVGSPINNTNITNNDCDIAEILKYTTSHTNRTTTTTTSNIRENLKNVKSKFGENDTTTASTTTSSMKLSPLKASNIIIPRLANKDAYVTSAITSLSSINSRIMHTSISNSKSTSTTIINDNMNNTSIDIINNMIDITKKSKHWEAYSNAIVQLGRFIITSFPPNVNECIDYHHQLLYRTHSNWSSLLSLILLNTYQPRYDNETTSNVFSLKRSLLAYLGT